MSNTALVRLRSCATVGVTHRCTYLSSDRQEAPGMAREQRAAVRELERMGYQRRGFTGTGHVRLIHPEAEYHPLHLGNMAGPRAVANTLAQGRRIVKAADDRWRAIYLRVHAGEALDRVLASVAKELGMIRRRC